MLQLTESDVSRLLDMPTTIEIVEEAFRQLAIGQAVNVPRVRAQAPGVVLHSMCAVAPYLGTAGWKCYTTSKQGAKFHVGLSDAITGELLALIEADRLGQMRTGAATGVAVKYLADGALDKAGLFGTGWQAQSQLEAIAAVRPLRRIAVYSRDSSKRRHFAEEMSRRLSIEVVPADRPQDAVASMPLVVTATSARQPMFDGRLIDDGALICAIGSNWLNKAEIDPVAVGRANLVVCDSVEACRNEAGDLAQAAAAGAFDWTMAMDLSAIVAQQKPVGIPPGGLTIFKSVGLAIEDVAVATYLYRKSQEGSD